MLCLALALQLEIVHLRKISKVRIEPRKWGPKLRAKWGVQRWRAKCTCKKKKGVNSFVRGTVHFIGYREITVLKGPVQLQCGLDEGPFPASMGAECDPQPRQTLDDCLCTLPPL
jgi:hypothetical protein